MTLNGVIVLILRYFAEFDSSAQSDYATLVEDRPTGLTPNVCKISSSSYSWPKL